MTAVVIMISIDNNSNYDNNVINIDSNNNDENDLKSYMRTLVILIVISMLTKKNEYWIVKMLSRIMFLIVIYYSIDFLRNLWDLFPYRNNNKGGNFHDGFSFSNKISHF